MVTSVSLLLLLLLLPIEIHCSTETPALQPSIANDSNPQNFYMDIQSCSKLTHNANKGFSFHGEVLSILRHAKERPQPRLGLIRMYEAVRPVCLEIILEYTTVPTLPISSSLVLTATCNRTTVQVFGIETADNDCASLLVNGISSGENCLPVGGRVQIEYDGANYMIMETVVGDVLAVSSGATPTAVGLDNVERIKTRFGVDLWQAQRDRNREAKSTKCNCDAFHDFSQWVFGCTGSKEMTKGSTTKAARRRSRNTAVLSMAIMFVGLPTVLITALYHAVKDFKQQMRVNGVKFFFKWSRGNK